MNQDLASMVGTHEAVAMAPLTDIREVGVAPDWSMHARAQRKYTAVIDGGGGLVEVRTWQSLLHEGAPLERAGFGLNTIAAASRVAWSDVGSLEDLTLYVDVARDASKLRPAVVYVPAGCDVHVENCTNLRSVGRLGDVNLLVNKGDRHTIDVAHGLHLTFSGGASVVASKAPQRLSIAREFADGQVIDVTAGRQRFVIEGGAEQGEVFDAMRDGQIMMINNCVALTQEYVSPSMTFDGAAIDTPRSNVVQLFPEFA